jgi:hypothetical protein
MRNNNHFTFVLAFAIAAGPCLAAPCSAGATDAPVPEQAADALPAANVDADPSVVLDDMLASERSVPSTRDEHAMSDMGVPVDAGALEQLRGGDGTVDNDVLMDGTVGGNTADYIVSGANAISDGSFASANGINTVIQNTGSNVLIQNGMVVNVQFVAPAP